jgi:hypothetical protein
MKVDMSAPSASGTTTKPRKSTSIAAAKIAKNLNDAANANTARRAAEAAPLTNTVPPANAVAPPAALSTNTVPPANTVAPSTNTSINTTTKALPPPASNTTRSIEETSTPVVVAAPVVAAAANAVTNAKNEEVCFIYSNALTKGTFKKGCIVVYKANKTSSDRSADMLQQLLAQKDLQVVKGGVQTSFVQSINDKTSLFIAYVEVMNAPTDKQIEEMKASISKAIRQPSPTKGGKRFHTKKRHAKKKTTRRRS